MRVKARTAFFVLFSLAALHALPVSAQKLVNRIEITGNEKTQPRVIFELSQLQRYQEITHKLLDETKKRVESSELFEEVSVKLVEPSNGNPERYSNVLITVKEKISWFAAPILEVSSKTLNGGVLYGESNLMGLNKTVLGVAQYGNKLKQAFGLYRDPSLLASHATLQLTGIAREDLNEEYRNHVLAQTVNLRELGGTALPGYRWDPNFTTSIGIDWRYVFYDRPDVIDSTIRLRERSYLDVRNIALRIEFKYNRMTSHYGLKEGQYVSLVSEVSDERFWSETNYFLQELEVTLCKMLFRKQNATYKFKGILGSTLPFNKEVTTGGTSLRGYLDREFRGDTMVRHNLEYFFPLFDVWKLVFRMTFFWDSGLIFFQKDGVRRDDWRNGVGGGLRLYIKNIVVPLMGFDVGYGIEKEAYALYFNIGMTY